MVDLISTLPVAQQQNRNVIKAVQDYGKRLFWFIRGRVKTNEDAEDILQDVWYQLSSLVDVEPIEQLSAWLFKVARNRITDKQRKQKPQLLEDIAFEDDEGEWTLPEAIIAGDATPETEFERAFFWEELFAALNELPQEQRQVFIWNELEDMTLQQIADKTGDNIKTIISRKRYAVEHLRERLQDLYNEY